MLTGHTELTGHPPSTKGGGRGALARRATGDATGCWGRAARRPGWLACRAARGARTTMTRGLAKLPRSRGRWLVTRRGAADRTSARSAAGLPRARRSSRLWRAAAARGVVRSLAAAAPQDAASRRVVAQRATIGKRDSLHNATRRRFVCSCRRCMQLHR